SPGVFAQNEWDKGYFFNSNQRWVENATFTVSFNANGGSVSPSSAATGANGQLSSSQIPTPTRTGYSFAGWFTTSAASGGTQLTTSTSHVAPTTYWARWIVNTYPVSYNANGGSNPPSTQTKIHGTNLTLTNNVPASPTYTITYNVNGGNALPSNSKTVSRPFKNWNTNSAGTGTSYNRGATYSANAGATLFAQWDNPLAGTLPVPTNGKLFFWGWFTAPTGGNQVTSLTRIKSNTTLYARWSSYPYGVFHFKNAGNGLYLSESETTPPLVPNKILNSDAQRWVVRRLSLSNYYRLDNIVEDLGNMFVGNFKGISVSFGLTNSTMTAVGNSIESLPFDEDSLFQKWNLEAHPITYTQGDINQDGVINTQDFVLAIQFSTGARTPTALQAYLADVNKDGQITQADADMILGMY
ncbi:MAG: InlB B-repeat-containing protein, partial [Oscillospiraceae bacterium]|nr:InlB B-repeat-containing protein [Oscillospiraceae bacterium]